MAKFLLCCNQKTDVTIRDVHKDITISSLEQNKIISKVSIYANLYYEYYSHNYQIN
jgi:hypothetical protein